MIDVRARQRPLTAILLAWASVLVTVPEARAQATIDLSVTSRDGTVLAGTLFKAPGSGPQPVVVILHGSEPGTRSHRGYLRWADGFRERGIAALVYDKRGTGESEGVYVEAPDLSVPAEDVLAWVQALKQRDDIDARRIGVLGQSQGGWVGPLAASRSSDIAFVVSISGPGVSPLEQNIYDKTNQYRATGASPERVEQFSSVIRLVWTYLATGGNRDSAQLVWERVGNTDWFRGAYEGPPMLDREIVLADARMEHYAAHQTYDPAIALERLTVPLLAVFGGADPVVPVEESIEAMRRAFGRSGQAPLLTVVVVPRADHAMRVRQPDGSGGFAPGYPELVYDWVVEQLDSNEATSAGLPEAQNEN